jgi:HK97 family phage prohead protease
MEGFEDYLVTPIEGKPDYFAFRTDFVLEGKALEDGTPAQTVTEEENGDLIIEGWAASFEGLDRQGENFVPGAFQRGIKSFLSGQSPLCFHHKYDMGIGSVLDLQEHPDKGLWMKARVDYQPEQSPLRHIYNAVKKGSYKGLSVGGFFKRALVEGRRMIADMDFTEVSVTPVAVHPKTKFAVVAGKALANDLDVPDSVGDVNLPDGEIRQEDFERFQWALAEIAAVLDRIDKRTSETPAEAPVEVVTVGA